VKFKPKIPAKPSRADHRRSQWYHWFYQWPVFRECVLLWFL